MIIKILNYYFFNGSESNTFFLVLDMGDKFEYFLSFQPHYTNNNIITIT